MFGVGLGEALLLWRQGLRLKRVRRLSERALDLAR